RASRCPAPPHPHRARRRRGARRGGLSRRGRARVSPRGRGAPRSDRALQPPLRGPGAAPRPVADEGALMAQVEGAVIGDRYRLLCKIGEGGMASVWEAEHVALGSRLAVKFLHRTAPKDSEMAQRFLREARVAASV